jgi:probable H4MPT-linked C1 transfer pathway protein
LSGPRPLPVLGLDVGGANLKAAHSAGPALSRPFPLWRRPGDLPAALRDLLRELPPAERLAVTMTGELCDCFESKRQGVAAILDAVEAAAGPVPVRVWTSDGAFVASRRARAEPLKTAAANWLALATFAGRFVRSGPALLLDIGSTTTDIIGLLDGRPVPQGRTDPERLTSGELVYRGVRRTPLCALIGAEGSAELFATTLDVYLVLGNLPEDGADRDTADGRPATRACAHARLARMLCADLETCTEEQRRKLALLLNLRLVRQLASAVERVAWRLPAPPGTVVVSGSGEFLARVLLPDYSALPPCPLLSLAERLGPGVSAAACAHAVAVLCREAEG